MREITFQILIIMVKQGEITSDEATLAYQGMELTDEEKHAKLPDSIKEKQQKKRKTN